MKFNFNILVLRRELLIFFSLCIIRYICNPWLENLIEDNFYLSFLLSKISIYIISVLIRVILTQLMDKNYYISNFFEKFKANFTIWKISTTIVILISREVFFMFDLPYKLDFGIKGLSLTPGQLEGLNALSEYETLMTINSIKWVVQQEGNELLDTVRDYTRKVQNNKIEVSYYLQATLNDMRYKDQIVAENLPRLVDKINFDNRESQNKLENLIRDRTLIVRRRVISDHNWSKLPDLSSTNNKSFDTLSNSLQKFSDTLDRMKDSLNKHRTVYNIIINKEATRLGVRADVLEYHYKNNDITPQGALLTTLQNSRVDPILNKLIPR